MTNKKSKSSKGIYTLIFLSMAFMFSSCMMMSPNHLNNRSDNGTNHSTMQTDFVCGQSFETVQDASFEYQYNSTTYYFHSEQCMKDFIQSPETYINNQSDHHRGNRRNGMMWGLGAVGMVAMMAIMFI
ncbi:MAG: YHS domain-containing protein [Bacteroidales bacterium]|jgi:YHS domain-containing protein|nr:YHS domain-containing protein [Bacteroidales bacterium]